MLASLSTDEMQAFIYAYPGMALSPTTGRDSFFKGDFKFEAAWGGVEVTDVYQLRIEVPPYPESVPRVFETEGRIHATADEHAFRNGQLCLGSELRLRMAIGVKLDLVGFADRCIVPYLYATTRRLTEGRFVLGELQHGSAGLVDDYKEIFGVRDEPAVYAALRTLTTKPSSAERHPCPCGCGKRLAQCEYRDRIDRIRQLAPRKAFQRMLETMHQPARSKS